ncbi:O-antigen/teichoic acid export membrane protein [Yoonia maritima]|uniref:O-antigen/teichoic acid export membrane protein n=1 Tax=Yoonia maritima TaxID=1435347 RepID=A0A2T0W0Z5_9RHOB|nr:O-antigen/teichoic acid export membrane protein [Yoonia maritima]
MFSRRKLLSDSLLLLAAKVGGIGVQLVTTIFLARSLALEAMGLYALFYTAIGISRAAGPLGIDQASTRLIAMAEAGNHTRVSHISLAGSGLTLLMGLTLGGAIWACSEFSGLLNAYSPTEMIIFSVGIPVFMGIGLLLGQIRGMGHNLLAQAPDALGLHVLLLIQILFLRADGALTLTSAMASLAIAGWAVFIFQCIVRLNLGKLFLGLPSKHTIRELITEGLRIFQAHFLTVATTNLPVFFAAALAGPAAVAIFEIARRFGNLFSVLTSSIGATYSPSFAKFSQSGETQRLKRLILDAGMLAGGAAFIYAVLIALLGKHVIGIFFPQSYLAAVQPMVIIAVATAINATFSSVSTCYLMSGRSHIVRNFTLAAFGIVCLISWWLGPVFGATGISIAIILSRLTRDGGIAYHFWKRSR